MWRRRREGAQVGPARADSPGHGSVGGRPRGAGGRLRWRGRARRMDSMRAAQVAWNPPAEFARQGTQTDMVPAPVAWPTEERLGSDMPSVYCTGCGQGESDGARFCSHCGTPLACAAPKAAGETTSIIPAVGGETGRG